MLDTIRPLFAFARCHRVMNEAYLLQQEKHGNRTAPTAALRLGAAPGLSLFWSKFGSDTCRYVDDLRAHLKESGARTRGGAAISLHLLLGVSADWIQETGGIHDGGNSRVRKLFAEVKAFADAHIGGVYSLRMDLDERGSGVVDVFAAPVHMRRGRPRKDGSRGKDVREVSVKSALIGLQRTAGGGKQFAALQTLWAHHAATAMDPRIVRGVPKTVTGRAHLSVVEYRESVEAERAWRAERDGQRQTILHSLAYIAKRDDEADAIRIQVDERRKVLVALESTVRATRAEIADRVAAADSRDRDLHARERDLVRTRAELIETARKQEEQRQTEREAAKRHLAEAEHAARIEIERAAIREQQANEVLASFSAREAELEARARKQTLADEASDRRAKELGALSSQLAAENARQQSDAAALRDAVDRLRRREKDVAEREAEVDRAARAHVESEAARRAEHQEQRQALQEAEAAALLREGEAIAAAWSAHQAEMLVAREAAASKVQRDALARERGLVASERSDLGERQAALDARERSARQREALIAERERLHAAMVGALETGLVEIGSGKLRHPADIATRSDLSLAADILTRVARDVAARVGQIQAHYRQAREAFAAKQQEAEAATIAAAERETAAREAERKYTTATQNFFPELKRLRRIRDLAWVTAKYADLPSLRNVSARLTSALDGLAVEFGIKSRQGSGKDI